MRFPWQKPEYEFYEEGKPRKKETLRQTAEKIIQKRMKRDENYGIKVSEKIIGVAKDEGKSLAQELKAFRELRLTLKEVMGTEEGKSSFLRDLLSVMPDIMAQLPAVMQGLRGGQGQYIQQGTTVPQIEEKATPPPQPPSQPQVTQPQAPPPAKLGELLIYLEHSPDKAVEALTKELEKNNIQAFVWLSLLKVKTYDEIVELLKPFEANAEYGEAVHKLLNKNGGKWLKRFVELAKLMEY